MKITRELVAQMLIDYLHHQVPMAALVDWAEKAMMDADFEEEHFDTLRDITARVGLADVRAFGLTWEAIESFLNRLGYQVHLQIEPA